MITTTITTTAAATTAPLPQRVSTGPRRDVDGDNLRDIGTWSNEQASNDPNRNKRGPHGNRAGPGGINNRYASTVSSGQPAGGKTTSTTTPVVGNNAEEWENEEEWQGDLTQTQIFTSSSVAQKKTDAPQAISGSSNSTSNSGEQQPGSAFSIGHFNAEEAAQNIKNAVGVSD